MVDLRGHVAVVTGASRGVGKGIALALGEAGALVYITGRTLDAGTPSLLPGTLHETVMAVHALGGQCIAVQVNHRADGETQAFFKRVADEQGRLDILVNNVWGGYEYFHDGTMSPNEEAFWTLPLSRWEHVFDAGVRAHFVASVCAAPIMVEQGSGLIVNISYWAGQKYMNNLLYGLAKAADDRMAFDMARELRPFGVAAVALYPGLVRTEGVMKFAEYFDLSNSESPQFTGRAVAHLAADPGLMEKSGRIFVAAQLARDYGFTDIDGKRPEPLTLNTA